MSVPHHDTIVCVQKPPRPLSQRDILEENRNRPLGLGLHLALPKERIVQSRCLDRVGESHPLGRLHKPLISRTLPLGRPQELRAPLGKLHKHSISRTLPPFTETAQKLCPPLRKASQTLNQSDPSLGETSETVPSPGDATQKL
jgi:hypothetical protein